MTKLHAAVFALLMITVSLAGCTGLEENSAENDSPDILDEENNTGNNSSDILEDETVLLNTSFVEISAGGTHTCAIIDDGSVNCWGRDHRGQLGNGIEDSQDIRIPTPTASLGEGRTAVAISSGRLHTCVLLDVGSVSCWGYNEEGALGIGTYEDSNGPTLTANLGEERTAIAISSGGWHTCALLDNGSVSCWGSNHNGQLGDGTNVDRNVPTLTASLGEGRTAVAISSGVSHTCAILDDGSVSCWGLNNMGQLGNGTNEERDWQDTKTPSPTASLGDGRTAVAISAGESTCVILDDGSVSCWGSNWEGEIGDGTNEHRSIPAPTASLGDGRTAVAIDVEYSHVCAILDDGSVSCWGKGLHGELGDGNMTSGHNQTVPTTTDSLREGRSAVRISAGMGFTCVLLDDSTFSCWGSNSNGQLGDGSHNSRPSP